MNTIRKRQSFLSLKKTVFLRLRIQLFHSAHALLGIAISPDAWGKCINAALLLNLMAPLLLAYTPVFAEPEPIPNTDIQTDERGDALFINKNPSFTAEFGKKENPGSPTLSFAITTDEAPENAAITLELESGAVISDPSDLPPISPTTPSSTAPISPTPPITPESSPSSAATPPISDAAFNAATPEQKIALLKQEIAAIKEESSTVIQDINKEVHELKKVKEESKTRTARFTMQSKQQAALASGAGSADILSAGLSEQDNAATEVRESSPSATQEEFNARAEKSVMVSENALDGINLVYEVLENKGVKESVLITPSAKEVADAAGKPVMNSFVYTMEVPSSIRVQRSLSGVWGFLNAEGEYLSHFERPFMVDSQGRRSNDVSINIVPIPNTQYSIPDTTHYQVRVTANLEWLMREGRAFPVNIDPSIVHDTQGEFTAGEEYHVTVSATPTIDVNYHTQTADAYTVGLWHMEDNVSGDGQTISDKSGESNTGTTAGGASMDCTVAGQVGSYACDFDGTDDYITVGSPDNLLITGDLTIAVWVNADTIGNAEGIISTGWSSDESEARNAVYQLTFETTSGNDLQYVHEYGAGTNETATFDTNLSTDTWYHITLTRNISTNVVLLYVNGQPAGSYTYSSDPTGGTDGLVELARNANSLTYLDGSLDEVIVANRVFTPEEIAQLANRESVGSLTSPILDLGDKVDTLQALQWSGNGLPTGDGETPHDTTSLAAFWKLNETSGTSAANAASITACGTTGACNGSLVNFATTSSQDAAVGTGWSSDNALWPASAPSALMFDGSNDYVSVGDNANLDFAETANFTVEAWVNHDGAIATNPDYILTKADTTNGGYKLWMDASGDLCFGVDDDATWTPDDQACTTGVEYDSSGWHHVVGVKNATTSILLYVDGKQVASDTTIAATATLANANPLFIGVDSDASSNPWDGIIDAPRIYSRALSANEVLSNYNGTSVSFQTRTALFDGSSSYTWDAWEQVGSDTQLLSFDTDIANWSFDNGATYKPIVDETVLKTEGTGSMETYFGGTNCADGRVAHWTLDEASGTRYDACSNNNLTDTNTVTSNPGKIGTAGQFTAANTEYLTIADNAPLSTGDIDFTISAWVKLDTDGAIRQIMGKSNNASQEYVLYYNWGTDSFTFIAGGGTVFGTNWPVSTGTWYFVTAWHDSVNDLVGISVNNGTPQTSSTGGTGPTDGTLNFNIGIRGNTQPWDGAIDEVSFWKRVLSTEERTALYQAGKQHILGRTVSSTDLTNANSLNLKVAADNPGTQLTATVGESAYANWESDANTVGLWNLEENPVSCTTSTCVDDVSSSNNDGFKADSPTFDTGVMGKAWNFDGSNDYVKIPDSNSLDLTTNGTLEAWVKADTVGNYRAILEKGTNWQGGRSYYSLYTAATNRVLCDIGNASAYNQAASPSEAFTTGAWYHVACTWDGSTLKLFVNGVLTTSTTQTVNADTTTGDLYIGRAGVPGALTDDWDGAIDLVRVSNTARSADDIRQAYEVGKRTYPITSDFVAKLSADDLITNSGDTSFEVDATLKGLPAQATNLTQFDTVIVREFSGGVEYTAQGTVSSVNTSSGAASVLSWNNGSTFPSGGYTASAIVTKWQTVPLPLSPALRDEDGNAMTRVTLRNTNNSSGATVWLDDLRYGGSASADVRCTGVCAEDILSNRNRYFQYKALPTSHVNPHSGVLGSWGAPSNTSAPAITEVRTIYADSVGLDDITTASIDADGNKHLGSNSVTDTFLYDRTKDQMSYALEFDGTNDYVAVGTGPSSVKTLEFWAYPETTTEYFVNFAGSTDYVWANSGTVTATGFTSPTIYVNGVATSTIEADKWQHVAVTTATAEDASLLDLGRVQGSNYLEGKLDEVALFSDERTAREVSADMGKRRLDETDTTTYDNLSAIYHFDEGGIHGTSTMDSKGTYHGTLSNMTSDDWVWSGDERDQSPLPQQGIGVDPNWGNGVVRQSYSINFDGTNDYAYLPTKIITMGDSPPLTISAWVNPTAFSGVDRIVSLRDETVADNNKFIQVFLNGTGQVGWWIANSGGAVSRKKCSSITLSTGAWQHVTLTWNGSGDPSVYVDGKSCSTITSQSDDAAVRTIGVWIGGAATNLGLTEFFNGKIDEIGIYSDVRTAAEVSADFRRGRSDDADANLIGLWHFDEGADNTCSGAANDLCDGSTFNYDLPLYNVSGSYWVTGSNAVMDSQSQYLALGASSSVADDSAYEIYLDTETTFKYRKSGAASWTTPATATISSYPYATPVQIDSTGVYLGFDTTNGVFSEEDHFDIPSWALEAFSTNDSGGAMRGQRNSFPEKSYLISQSDYLDIIDAESNLLWMRLPQGTNYALGATSNNELSSVTAQHGNLFTTTNGASATGLYQLDFMNDALYRYNDTDRSLSDKNISARATTNTYGSGDAAFAIIGNAANEVSTQILKGLRYIAVATDAGATLLRETVGEVANILKDSDGGADEDIDGITLLPTEDLYAYHCEPTTNCSLNAYYNVTTQVSEDSYGEHRDKEYDNTSSVPNVPNRHFDITATAATSTVDASSNTLYLSTDDGLAIIQEKQGDESNGSTKLLTKDYITEEMVGDIQLMLPFTENPAGGGTFVDRSLKSTAANTVNLTDVDGDSETISGVRGKGFDFNGDADYASIADNASLSTGDIDFTLGAWVKIDDTSTSRTIIHKGTGTGAGSMEYWLRYVTGTDRLRLEIADGATTAEATANNFGAVPTGTWMFVVAWHDAANNQIGIQVNNGTANTTSHTTGVSDLAGAFHVGAILGGTNNWDGAIDEVFMTKEVLSTAQKTRIYQDGLIALNKGHAGSVDTNNELIEATSRVLSSSPTMLYHAGYTRAESIFIGSNGTGGDDGGISVMDASANILTKYMLEGLNSEPAITDEDVSSVSCSGDAVYCVVGTDADGVTILYSQGNQTSAAAMRHGKTFGSGRERPMK